MKTQKRISPIKDMYSNEFIKEGDWVIFEEGADYINNLPGVNIWRLPVEVDEHGNFHPMCDYPNEKFIIDTVDHSKHS